MPLPVNSVTPLSLAVGKHLVLSLHLSSDNQHTDVMHQTSSAQVQLGMCSYSGLVGYFLGSKVLAGALSLHQTGLVGSVCVAG